MNSVIARLKRVEAFSLLVGVAVGAALSLILFSYLVPNGLQMKALYDHKMAQIQAQKNEKEIEHVLHATTTTKVAAKPTTQNHYQMAPVTSERQFLKEMILHHEAAVTMSNQLLALKNVRPEVSTLAKNIISAQATEIKMMKDWIAAWKY